MPKHEVVPATTPVPATLTEQKADFTAEGAPPPGKVATTPPVTTAAVAPVARAGPKPGPRAAKKSQKSQKRAG